MKSTYKTILPAGHLNNLYLSTAPLSKCWFWFYASLLGSIVLAGCWLRFKGLGSTVVQMDEIHSVINGVSNSFPWILSNFTYFDSCIPLSLYIKLLTTAGFGITESVVRLPGALAGAMTLVLWGWFLLPRVTLFQTLSTVALIAFSPYLVYLSREARPYPIVVFLVSGAVFSLVAWLESKKQHSLFASAIFSSLALFFHPIALPALCILWAFPLAQWATSRERCIHLRDYAIGATIAAGCTLLLLGPSLVSLLGQFGVKGGSSYVDLDTVRYGVLPIFGIKFTPNPFLWVLMAVFGAMAVPGRLKPVSICLLTMAAGQFLFLAVTKPVCAQVPMVWLRYWSFLIPFFLFFLSSALHYTVQALLKNKSAMSLVGAGLGIIFFGYNFLKFNYDVTMNGNYGRMPIVMYMPCDLTAFDADNKIPQFYKYLAASDEKMAVVETPIDVNYPIYGLYQRYHKKEIYAGALGSHIYQDIWGTSKDLAFERIIPMNSGLPAGIQAKARYLIVHKKLWAELTNIYDILQFHKPFQMQAHGGEIFASAGNKMFFANLDLTTEDLQKIPLTPCFEDEYLQVFDLRQLP